MKENLKEEIIKICQLIYTKGFVAATDGNVSVRIPDSESFLATASGVNKGLIQMDDIVEVSLNGEVISGLKKPSTEIAMHLFIYSERKDINAVVHAHPPFATGFATAREALTGCILPEVIIGLGAIPLADYATPSTVEMVKSIEPYVKKTDAILLANHGIVTYGRNLLDAYFKLEKVEHAAHVTFIARLLGGEKYLSLQDVEKLKSISEATYGKIFSEKLSCIPSESKNTSDEDYIKTFIRKILNK